MKNLKIQSALFLIFSLFGLNSNAEQWTYVSLENTSFQNLYSGAIGYFTFKTSEIKESEAPAIFVFTFELPKNWEPSKNKQSWAQLLSLLGDQSGKTLVKDSLIHFKNSPEVAYRFNYNYMGLPNVAYQTAGLLRVHQNQVIVYIYDRSGIDFSKYSGLVERFFAEAPTRDIAALKTPQKPLISSNRAKQKSSP